MKTNLRKELIEELKKRNLFEDEESELESVEDNDVEDTSEIKLYKLSNTSNKIKKF